MVCLGACGPGDTGTEAAEPVSPQLVMAQTPAPKQVLSGEALFMACQGCHNLQEGAAHQVGPNLHGIIGQPAATRPGYTYSDALKNSGIIWSAETLTAWVVASEAMAPGTWMAYSNIVAPDEMERLVGYIVTQSSGAETGEPPP